MKAGERVQAGQVVGTIGRTGKNAWPRRSQTHLHFGLWDASTFRPVNSYPLLRRATGGPRHGAVRSTDESAALR